MHALLSPMFLSQFASLVPFKEKPKYDSNGGFRELLLIQATSAFKLNMHLEICCACVQGFSNLFLSAGESVSFYLPLFTRVRVACFPVRGMVDDLTTIGIKNHTNITSLTINK